MLDVTDKETCEWVDKLIDEAIEYLKLYEWEITWGIADKYHEIITNVQRGRIYYRFTAKVATIHLSPFLTKRDALKTIAHEIWHLVLAPFSYVGGKFCPEESKGSMELDMDEREHNFIHLYSDGLIEHLERQVGYGRKKKG